MNALDAMIRQRNARLRACAWLSLPLEGTWVRVGAAVVVHLACGRCREGLSERFHGAPAGMALFERGIILRLLQRGCGHLQPMLREDSEALQTRTREELRQGPRWEESEPT